MYDMPERIRGVQLCLLDIDAVTDRASEQLGAAYGAAFTPYAAVEHGALYVVCNEGVGWLVAEDAPLELGLYARRPGYTAIAPSYMARLTPDEVRDVMTGDPIDLADLIRVHGDRLEGNFWMWHRRLRMSE